MAVGPTHRVADPTFDPPGEYAVPLPGDHKIVKTDPAIQEGRHKIEAAFAEAGLADRLDFAR
ncbi:hypothetical protein [Streptomyces sp. NPDC020597]|uniref:hypothetical protein n=1 Tax=unclassified Streptomyces TaxID=2593676 RepID=UPI0037A540A3